MEQSKLDQLKKFLIDLYSGDIGRKDFVNKHILAFLATAAVAAVSTGLSLLLINISEALAILGSILHSIVIILVAIANIVYILALDTKRLRRILSSRPKREIYFVLISGIILSVVIPLFGFLFVIALAITPDHYSNSEFYRKNLEKVIENLTNKIISLTK